MGVPGRGTDGGAAGSTTGGGHGDTLLSGGRQGQVNRTAEGGANGLNPTRFGSQRDHNRPQPYHNRH